jgi:hypothetical protein
MALDGVPPFVLSVLAGPSMGDGNINLFTLANAINLLSGAAFAIKAPVRAATTGANIVLFGLQTIDGVALANGDRVLVKDQADPTANGIYSVSSRAWARTIDANVIFGFVQGTVVLVTQGVANIGATFEVTTANPIVVGNSPLSFALIGLPPSTRLQRSVTASPVVIGPNDQVLNINVSAGAPTCALPPAATRNGMVLTFKDVGAQFGAHNLTITPNGAETIDGAASLVLAINRQAVTLNPFNDGVDSGWFIT